MVHLLPVPLDFSDTNLDAALKAETLRFSSDSGDEGTPRSRQKKQRIQGEHRPVWERNKSVKRYAFHYSTALRCLTPLVFFRRILQNRIRGNP